VGYFYGERGVEIYSVIGAGLCGWFMPPIATLLICISPIGQGITNAGADAFGAASFTAAKKTVGSILVVCAFHLLCGICVICVMAARRFGINGKIGAIAAGIGAILSMYLISQLRGIPFSGIQWRYMLPALIYLCSNFTG
jgi:hypothetical protein